MEIMSIHFLTALGTIVLMDILLGGDNAVVIAMAANKLPHELRKKAIFIGTRRCSDYSLDYDLCRRMAADHSLFAGSRRLDSFTYCCEAAGAS